MATVTGIVRRAWPTASDQRWTVVPRSPGDLRLGPAPKGESAGTSGGGDGASEDSAGETGDGPDGPGESGGSGAISGPVTPDGAIVARLADLRRLAGRRVRVGATVAATGDGTLTLRDGAAQATVRLTDTPPDGESPIVAGEVVNVTGTVSVGDPDVDPELTAAAADITRAARLALPPTLPASPGPDRGATDGDAAPAPVASAGPGPAGLLAPLLVLIAMVIGGGAVLTWGVRRRQAAAIPASTPTPVSTDGVD